MSHHFLDSTTSELRRMTDAQVLANVVRALVREGDLLCSVALLERLDALAERNPEAPVKLDVNSRPIDPFGLDGPSRSG
jgi:hypothetical protein